MSTYYKHKRTASVDIPYSFTCEQCMKDSGTLSATIEVDATINSNHRELEANKDEKLKNNVHAKLVREVKSAHQNATENQIFIKAFKDKCPHCQQPQSWAVSGLKDDMFTWPIALVIIGVVVGLGCYFFTEVENNMMIAIITAGVCFALAIATLIFNMLRISNKKKKTSTSLQKNVPVIDWGAVSNLLNEE